MPRRTLTLGRLFDIRVGVHVSWLAVYAFMSIALARGVTGLPRGGGDGVGGVCAVVVVARRFGVRTSAITLFLFGGVATLEEEPPSPKADAVVALAGPAMSAALAVIAFALLFAVDRFVPGRFGTALGYLGTYVALANAVLAVFNVIPAYPMDGGRVLRAFLWRRWHDRAAATNAASRVGIVFALLLVAAGVFLVAGSHELVYGWYVVLGAFLLRQGLLQERAARSSGGPRDATAGAVA